MPVYLYQCECENSTEINHGMNDKPDILCNKCGKSMRKSLKFGSVSFSGSGFYSTDK